MKVAVIDHGAGNLVSMVRALEMVGAEPSIVTSGPLDRFDRVVLPGVGATGPAMRTLNHSGLTGELRGFGGQLLGVCVGMQLLFDFSTEDDTECLGLIAGTVQRLTTSPLPHIGWNAVSSDASGLFLGLARDELFYFLHSFAVRPSDQQVSIGETTYGTDVFTTAVAERNVTGVQFHPERSGSAGLAVLANFVNGAGQVRRVA